MSNIITANMLENSSFEEQVFVLSCMYETLFSEAQQDESKDMDILKPEFYPMIVKHAEDPDKSDKRIFVKLLGRAAKISILETRTALLESGALPIFLSCLLCKDEETLTEGLNSIMVIASDQQQAKYMMTNGVVMLLINVLTDLPNIKLVSLVLDALITLSKATMEEGDSKFLTPVISFFPNLMDAYEYDESVVTRLCEMCNILADTHLNDDCLIQAINYSGVLTLFCEILENQEGLNGIFLKEAISLFLTLMSVQKPEFIEEVSNMPIIEHVSNYFQDPSKWEFDLLLKLCAGVRNIATNIVKGQMSIFDSESIPRVLVELIKDGGNPTLQRESIGTLKLITGRSLKSEIQQLVAVGCIPVLCNALSSQDNRIFEPALTGLHDILQFTDETDQFELEVKNCDGVVERLVEISKLDECSLCEPLIKGILERCFPDAARRYAEEPEVPIPDTFEYEF